MPGPHDTALHRAQLYLRRQRWVLAGAVTAALLLALAVSLAWRHVQRGEDQARRGDEVSAYLAQALAEVAGADPLLLAPRLQQALEQARGGFAGRPVLRGQVLTALALRFRALGQPEQALAVLREAVALLQGTAAGEPALQQARAELAWQLLEAGPSAAAQARTLAQQVLDGCGKATAACEAPRLQAADVLRRAAP